jgi:hypothetical protein
MLASSLKNSAFALSSLIFPSFFQRRLFEKTSSIKTGNTTRVQNPLRHSNGRHYGCLFFIGKEIQEI